jgi:membrane-bound lytic murein transglycosylase D
LKAHQLITLFVAAVSLIFGCSHIKSNTPAAEQSAVVQPGEATGPSDGSDGSEAAAVSENASAILSATMYPQTNAAATTASAIPLINDTEPALGGPDELDGEESQPVKEEQTSLDEALDFCDVAQSFWQKGELENALEALDKAYSLILDVDTQQNVKLTQQKEDLRFLISKRILEIYASRNIVVNGNHDEIPLEMNIHVEKELKRFMGYEKSFFEASYARSGLYRPYMVEALREAGLPEELSWLPLIESGFKVKALSRARALGLWQFIPSTGYKFGLKRNKYIDERIDPVKATNAAIDYLKELHSMFGDWATVLAAYNCGEGRVLKVIRTQKINYLDNFWDLYQRLPMETARYVPRFYATLHIVKNPEKYGFTDLKTDTPLKFDTLEISRQVHLKHVAKTIGADAETLKALNPELRHQILPPENYSLRIPEGQKESLLASLDSIPVSQLPQRAYVYHRVRSGQTLSTIARRYRTSVKAIMRANNLRSSHLIRAGQRLKIPTRGYRTATAAVSRGKQPPPSSGIHYVRKGDSLWIIANRYGTTVKKIQALNHLSSNRLHIGQSLKIPGFKPEPLPDTSKMSTYAVQNGDSPYTIAQKHNISLERLMRINQLTPRSKIFPGQKLFIE